MSRWVALLGGGLALAVAVGALVHVRSRVVAERYALGQALDHEQKLVNDGAELRDQWERLSDPMTLRRRAEQELGMQVPSSRQVLR